MAWCRRFWLGRHDSPAIKPPYLDEEEWSSAPPLAKDDSVAAIIHATNSHANRLDQVAYDPATGTATLTFLQPDEANEHWEYQLRLTFTDVRSFGIGSASHAVCEGADVVSLSCERVSQGYSATIILGSGDLMWAILLIFNQLRYDRSPRRPWE